MRLVWPFLLLSCGGQIAGPSDAASGTDASGTDAAKDAPTVTEGGPPSDCVAHGGEICTDARWMLCPFGYEPVSQTEHYGCGFSDGWCCKPAPASPCTQSGTGNCIDSCGSISSSGCWIISVSLGCETGKVCCADGCD